MSAHRHPLLTCALLSILLLLAPAAHGQGFVWPSSEAPCNGSLQACVNGVVDGARIQIDSDEVSPLGASSLSIARSLDLVAAPGRRPRLPAGANIGVNLAGSRQVFLQGLELRGGGQVLASRSSGSGTAELRVEGMRFEHAGVFGGGIDVTQGGFAEGTLRLHIRDNRYRRTGGAGNFASVQAQTGLVSGEIAFNRIEVPDGSSSAYGIVVGSADDGRFDLSVAANHVVGSFVYGAVCGLSAGPASAAAASVLRVHSNVLLPHRAGNGVGICGFAGESPLAMLVTNNTLLDQALGVALLPRPFNPPASTAPITGTLANNLFSGNGQVASLGAVASAVGNRNNLLWANGSSGSGFSPGVGTVNANPLLVSRRMPYLGAGSPAIDAGHNDSVPNPTQWPSLDADGLRRIKQGTVDIGAHEFGDAFAAVIASSANTTSNYVAIDLAASNGTPSAQVFATPNFSLGQTANLRPWGVFWGSNRWSVFNQDLSAMTVGAAYNLFVPAAAYSGPLFGDLGLFVARVPAGSGSSLVLDHPALNGRREARVQVTQLWNPQQPPLTAVYNNAPVTLQYFADERWRIANRNGAPLPSGAAFNVYVQPDSPAAFEHVASAGNSSGFSTRIDHPLLNGQPCARIQVVPVFGEFDYDVFYTNQFGGRWAIFSASGAVEPGSRFQVLLSPRQIWDCGGPLFADGFEG